MVHESQVPRSCDRCHSLKERCKRSPGVPRCERCIRIGHVCETRRPVKRPGRPPATCLQSRLKCARMKRYSQSIATNESDVSSSSPGPDESLSPPSSSAVDGTNSCNLSSVWKTNLSAFGHLSWHELALLDRAVHQDDFIQLFVLGPSFCEEHRQKLVFQLLSSHQTVLDGYLAFALSMGHDKLQINNSYRHAASALVKLRSLSAKSTDPSQIDSAPSCLMLGWQILHFVFKVGGGEILDICGQTLSLIKPYIASPNFFESAYVSFLTSLVLTETAECLFKTRLPTVRLDHPAAATHIDGCVGLCTSLLPFLYDLAVLNHTMAASRAPSSSGERIGEDCRRQPQTEPDMLEALDHLGRQVRDWQPYVPADFCQTYTAIEVARMMCQAQVTQTAMLLLIHRLRYPFGTQDTAACAMSSSILAAMELVQSITGKVPFCVDLALNVANVEVDDASKRAQNMARFTSIGSYSSVFHKRVRNMVNLIWSARHVRSNVYWCDVGNILSTFS